MPGTVNFKIEGAKEMERLLKELGPRVAITVADKALRAGAKPIVQEAKRLVRKRTRDLEKSITAVIDRRHQKPNERQILLGYRQPTSRRAHFEEFGRAGQPAHPHMRPAMDAKVGEALNEIGREMSVGITREAKILAKR